MPSIFAGTWRAKTATGASSHYTAAESNLEKQTNNSTSPGLWMEITKEGNANRGKSREVL